MSIFNVKAEYHMDLISRKTGKFFGYRVKAFILDDDLGFYINGMVVSPPECTKTEQWEVFTPTQGNARIIEFNGKESKLWAELKQACLNAVWEHLGVNKLVRADDNKLKDQEFNKELMKGMEDLGY